MRWNPEQENELFLSQAATISAVYYLHQIAIHRSFMSSRRESPISPLSTIICVNAARAAFQVIEVLYNRTGNPSHRNMVRPLTHDEIQSSLLIPAWYLWKGIIFVASMVLMTNMLGQKRSGGAVNASMEKDLASVGKCVEMLRSLRYEYVHLFNARVSITKRVLNALSPRRMHISETLAFVPFLIGLHRIYSDVRPYIAIL